MTSHIGPGFKANIFSNLLTTVDIEQQQFSDVFAKFDQLRQEVRVSIAKAKTEYEKEHAETYIEHESRVEEALLGASFVVAQVYISWVISEIVMLHNLATNRHVDLKTTNKSKAAIMTVGSAPAVWSKQDSGYSQIQVVDAFANYFKHRDEWPSSWSELGDHQRRTACIIKSVGAVEGPNDNMRIGAQALKLGDDLAILGELLENWRKDLIGRYRAELAENGLL
ncbi:MAG: hypothetical protein L0Z51_12465 [Candidatus Latescibacteria bacterium]|nr:hypothetical protein [Candidatus Latescibacterota bacterium]